MLAQYPRNGCSSMSREQVIERVVPLIPNTVTCTWTADGWQAVPAVAEATSEQQGRACHLTGGHRLLLLSSSSSWTRGSGHASALAA